MNFIENITIKELPNGIKIIHKQVDTALVSHLGIMIDVGSRDEEENEHGLAHFIEHSIFKGTKKRNATAILNRLETVGGEMNAYTAKEETCYYASFTNNYYERALELLSDITFNSIFPAKEIEKEKQVIYEEINSYLDSPSEQILDDFDELYFNKHVLGRNILGTPESLKKFKPQHLQHFTTRNYVPSNIVVSSVGNIAVDKLVDLVTNYLGHIKSKSYKSNRAAFKKYTAKTVSQQKSIQQLHCVLGSPAFEYKSKHRLPMILLNNIVGGSAMSSRLNMAVREKKGLVYDISTNYTAYSDNGVFSIYFGCDKNNLEKTNQIIFKEFKKLTDQKLSSTQLAMYKKQLIGHVALGSEGNLSNMLGLAKSLLINKKIESMNDTILKIEKLTAEDILEVANKTLNKESFTQLIYLPQ